MKWFVAILAIGALACSSAMADENNLANGAFITHYVSQIQYSLDLPAEGSWHGHYSANYAIDDCSEQVTDIPGAYDGDKIWFVLAAWQEDKVFAGAEFGIEYVEGELGYAINDHGPCFPVAGLELPSGAPYPVWPEPGSGIALTVQGDDAWQGNFVPVYYFWGYTYAAGTVAIIADPVTGLCGTANKTQNKEFAVAEDYRGAIGLNGTAGTAVCPPSDIPGACCIDGGNTCQLVLRSECTALGGHYQGDGTVCEPVNPCPTTWACCVGVDCYMLTQDDCVNLFGGVWFTDETCATMDCADVMHVCCLPSNDCVITTEAECLGLGGSYVTDPLFQSCDPNPCPVAVEETNWGAIKALYR